MGLFSSMTLNSLSDLFVVQIQDLYDAEQRLTKALPKMADAATNKPLKSGFQEHLRQTEEHVTRLEKVFSIMGMSPKSETCEAMKGLIAEGERGDQGERGPERPRRGPDRRSPARRALRDRRLRHRPHARPTPRPRGSRTHPPADAG